MSTAFAKLTRDGPLYEESTQYAPAKTNNGDRTMIVLPRKQGQGIVIDDRIFMTVSDIRKYDVCFEMSVPIDVLIQGSPRMFGHPGRSESGEQLAFVEIAPCPQCLWLRVDDEVSFHDRVSVRIVECKDDHIRLGLEAVEGVSVDRKEVWDVVRRDR